MLKRVLLTLMLLSAGGCATGASSYGPKASANSFGYQEMQMQSDRYRVSYTANNDSDAQRNVLLRAAELTLQNGYDHFQVIDGHVSGHSGPVNPVHTSAGIGISARGNHHVRPYVNVGVSAYDIGRSIEGNKITDTIEIRMLRGGSTANNVYDARLLTGSAKQPNKP